MPVATSINGFQLSPSLHGIKSPSVSSTPLTVASGIMVNWNQGVKADIHYKICDDGRYFLLDENNNVVMSIEDDYVPNCLSPKSNGYGDYIIMDVSEDGKISNWKFSTVVIYAYSAYRQCNPHVVYSLF